MIAPIFAFSLRNARTRYEQSDDFNAYIADCTYIALRMAAAGLAERYTHLSHLPTALSAAQYEIRGLTDTVADRMSCPIEGNQSHADFLSDFHRHTKKFVDHDIQVVKDILHHMGLR
jgi:hypothetical protein